MAEAQVAVPPNVLEAARPVAIPPPEPPPAGGESPALPTEEVGFFLSLFLRCSAPSICCLCYAESRLARVVLAYVAFSVSLALLLRVLLLGFLSLYSAYLFQASFMVFSAPILGFMACVTFGVVF